MNKVIKDQERQERLNQVYKHLFAYFDIKSQTQFADVLRVQRTALSAAMNGNKAYLTNNLFTKICAAFPNVFNYDYLVSGKGSLLTIEEEIKTEELEKGTQPSIMPSAFDRSIWIEQAVKQATAYANKTIAVLESQVADKEKTINDKNKIIELLQARIRELEAKVNQYESEKSLKFPFEMGVSEYDDDIHTRV